MRSNIARYSFLLILIHWVLAFAIVVMLGLGWYIQYIPPTTQSRSFLLDLHMSLGLTSALLLSIQIFLRVVFKPPSFPNEFPQWQRLLAYALYALIYVSLASILVSGYLQAVFNAMHMQFWGIPLPVWGVVDVTLAGFFGAAHGVAAVVLVGLIFVHVGVVGLNIFKYPSIATRMLLSTQKSPKSHGSDETKSPILSKIAERLAESTPLAGSHFGYSWCSPSFAQCYWNLPRQGVRSVLLQQEGSAMLSTGVSLDFCSCGSQSRWRSIARAPPAKSVQDQMII